MGRSKLKRLIGIGLLLAVLLTGCNASTPPGPTPAPGDSNAGNGGQGSNNGNGGGGVGGSSTPSQGSQNGASCFATPTPGLRFASQLVLAGTTQLGNGTCIPKHGTYVEVSVSSGNCSTDCTQTNADTYADFLEDGYSFQTNPRGRSTCVHNYPYTQPGCRADRYSNPAVNHSNENQANQGAFACSNAGSTINIYGTPGNPQSASPPGINGDAGWTEADFAHQTGHAGASGFRIYWTDKSCDTSSVYMTVFDTHVTNWWGSFYSGQTVSGVCAFASCPQNNMDGYFLYEIDQSTQSITNATSCGTNGTSTPCSPQASTVAEYGTDSSYSSAKATAITSWVHVESGTALTGVGYAFRQNGLSDRMDTSNSCYLPSSYFTSANALTATAEQPVYGFSGHQPDVRSMVHYLNCFSQIVNNTTGQFEVLDHESLPTTYQLYDDHWALKMLAYKPYRVSERLAEEDGNSTYMSAYPTEYYSTDPGDGFPAMAAFFPTNCSNCDGNGYDATATTDGNYGSGTDTNDRAADHGAVDLCAPGSTSLGLQDFKGDNVCVYRRIWDNMFFLGQTIQSYYSLGGNFMAVFFNPSTTAYQIPCGDLNLASHVHTYLHKMSHLPATPTANAMEVYNGGKDVFTTPFRCGTSSAIVPAESSVTIVS